MSRRDMVSSRAATYFIQTKGTDLRGACLAVGSPADSLHRLRRDLEWTRADSIGDCRVLGERGKRFDTVISLDGLQFEPHPGGAIEVLARLLETGGQLMVVAPNIGRDDADELWGFRPGGLCRLAEDAGLTVGLCENINSPWGGMVLGYLSDCSTGSGGAGLPPEGLESWATSMDELFPTSVALIAHKD